MERMMNMGAPPMTEERQRYIVALWQMAETSSNGSVEGFKWNIAVERNDSGNVIQIVATGQGCKMLINPGEYRPGVVGAVDAFFQGNLDDLVKIIPQA